MSKAHRGKGIRELAAHGRGECPVCHRTNVKILYELESDGAKIKVCKTCKAAIAHGKKTLPGAAPAAKTGETPAAAPPAAASAPSGTTPAAAAPSETAAVASAAGSEPGAGEAPRADETPAAPPPASE
ncbi:MAG: hypothetical protein LBN92_04855 [Treponema sp.]|jgi:ribosomal protein L37AE/L43A|nr:hypothetical protein [Treponema sp.]